MALTSYRVGASSLYEHHQPDVNGGCNVSHVGGSVVGLRPRMILMIGLARSSCGIPICWWRSSVFGELITLRNHAALTE